MATTMTERFAGAMEPTLPVVAGIGGPKRLAMIVPLRYLLGITTVPVGVPGSSGVAANELSVDILVSLFEVEFEGY